MLARDRVEKVLGEDAEVLAHFPGEALAGHRLRAALRLHHRLRPARPHRPARRLRHHRGGHRPRPHRDRLRRGRLPARRAVRDHAPEPGRRCDGTFDERVTDFAGRFVKEADPDIVEALEAQRASCCAPRPTCTPIRTAGAATPRSSTTRSRAGTSRPARSGTGCSPTNERDRLAPRAHQARPLRQVAREQRRLGALARPLLGDAAADLGVRREPTATSASAPARVADLRERGGEVPDDLHRPYIDEVVFACEREGCDGHDAAGPGRDRHLVRLGLDAVRAVPLPVRERGAVRGALPRRLHLRGDRPDPRLVLHAARRVGPALRQPELSATASASA